MSGRNYVFRYIKTQLDIRVLLNSNPREQPQNYEMRPHVHLFRLTDV